MTPMEGELARAHLDWAGIASVLESADLETWFWHYIYAFRGVTLRVHSSDRERALEILASANESENAALLPRECGVCGESLPGDWNICWRCGTDAEGTRDEEFFVDRSGQSQLVSYLREFEYLPLLLFLLSAAFVFMPVISLILLMLLPAYAFPANWKTGDTTWEPEEHAALPVLSTSADAGDELCRRAMASALFGVGWFFPLTFYSLWLLYDARGVSVGANGRLWRYVAWAVNVVYLIAIAASWISFFGSPSDGQFLWASY